MICATSEITHCLLHDLNFVVNAAVQIIDESADLAFEGGLLVAGAGLLPLPV